MKSRISIYVKTFIAIFTVIQICIDASAANTSPAGLETTLESARIQFSKMQLEQASVEVAGNELIVSTGSVEGRWKWTGKGFVTSGLNNLVTGKEWVTQEPAYKADWDLRLFPSDPELKTLVAEISTDENLTSPHLRIYAELDYDMPEEMYPDSGLRIRFEIWAYPGAPGLRTQLIIGTNGQWVQPGIASSEDYRVDYLPVTPDGLTRQVVGFYNNHDGRNADDIDFVNNEIISTPFPGRETYPSANMVFLYDEQDGVALIKESHKVVNKIGVNTGSFEASQLGLVSTGWGVALANLERGESYPAWASWRICWDQGEENKQLAVKMFDRLRYPVSPAEKVLTCNVWGGGQRSAGAREENILREIKSCSEIGIDVLQIDAGWQDDDPSTPAWLPKPEAYPDGWGKIMAAAGHSNVTLGIWTRAEDVLANPDKLIALYDAGFYQFKVDIGSWSTYDYIHRLTELVRELKLHSGHAATVNWDVTHKGLRVGYLFNREYGNLFLQNRRLPFADEGMGKDSHTYIPRRILKDQWRAADYLNLNQIMFNVQTTEYVHPDVSNARLYGDAYSFAIAMMSAPLFFTETWRYSPEDRIAVKNLISVYKKHRDDLYDGYVFSIGELPSDVSWTGFQNYHPEKDSGYLTLFRGIENTEEEKAITLRFIRNKQLRIENLMTGDSQVIAVDKTGTARMKIDEPASFRFYKYTIIPN